MEINFAASFTFAFFTTIAFGVLFQAPRKTLVPSGIIGAVGWVVFIYLGKELEYSSFYANFFATVALSLLSELSARLFRQPTTIFVIPGIIPIVPGLGIYQGMTTIIEKNYERGLGILLTACTDAVAIALGIMVMTSFFRVLKLGKDHRYLLQLAHMGEDGKNEDKMEDK